MQVHVCIFCAVEKKDVTDFLVASIHPSNLMNEMVSHPLSEFFNNYVQRTLEVSFCGIYACPVPLVCSEST